MANGEDVLSARCRLVMELIKTLGFPMVVSAALMAAAWHMGGQLVDSHKQFIAALANESQRHSNLLEQIARSQQESSAILRAIYREAVAQGQADVTVGIPHEGAKKN